MRKYENLQYGDEAAIRTALVALADKGTDVKDYREAFRILGLELGKVLATEYGEMPAEQTMLVCTTSRELQ